MLGCADVLDRLVAQVHPLNLVVVVFVLFVELAVNVYEQSASCWHLLVSVEIHAESIFTVVVRVVEADLDVRDVADLVLG